MRDILGDIRRERERKKERERRERRIPGGILKVRTAQIYSKGNKSPGDQNSWKLSPVGT